MQDTSISTLIINKLTKAQYEAATKDPEQLYFVTDDTIEISEVDGLQALLDTKADIDDVLPASTKYGADLSASVNQNTSQLSISLLDQDGNQLGTTQTVTLPDVDIDNSTITTNQGGEIQADGTIDHNPNANTPVYDWIGTIAEFNAQNIASLHPNWLCFITDDTSGNVVYTAAECDALFARKADTYTKTEIDTALANKANTDADNFTTTGEDYLAGLSFMGDRFEQLVPINGMTYTAPADGYFSLEAIIVNTIGNRLYLLYRPNKTYLYGNKTASMTYGSLTSYRQYVWIPVKKGGVVYVTQESTAPNPDFGLRFYYADGADYTPPEYTPVEYIEGTSNVQYIKSCIVPNSGMKLYCKAQITGNTSSFLAFGTRNTTYDGVQFNINMTNQTVTIDWFGGTDSTKRWSLNTTIAQNDIWELEIENSVATLTRNGTVVGTHTFTPVSTVTRELYLTALNNNGALGGVGTTGRLYEFKLWDDGDLIVDMQPVKDSANVACLYNTVSQTLFYNQGTGTYTAGPDINE